MGRTFFVAGALALSAFATPAFAQANDTKAGVDAFMAGDYDRAIRIWRPLAIAGDADAQYNLGQAYWLGRGVANDPKQAEDWYRRAAEQNQPKARDAYGLLLFQTGRRQEALPYIEESAGRSMPQAQYVYATLLFNGDLVQKDWVRSYALMTRASAAGVQAASAGLAQLDKFIPLDQRQRGLQLARAFELSANKPAMDPAPLPPAKSTPPKPIRTVQLPASQPGSTPDNPAEALNTGEAPMSPRVPPVKPAAKPMPLKPAPVKVAVAPAPAKPAPAPAQVGGNWRVQLGAFGDKSKAAGLWGTLRGKIAALSPYQSFVVPAGAVTRLQAGPLPSRAAADKLCGAVKAAGNACIPVAP
jgi:uncharacterized protein